MIIGLLGYQQSLYRLSRHTLNSDYHDHCTEPRKLEEVCGSEAKKRTGRLPDEGPSGTAPGKEQIRKSSRHLSDCYSVTSGSHVLRSLLA